VENPMDVKLVDECANCKADVNVDEVDKALAADDGVNE
jgi:hypothetical protein